MENSAGSDSSMSEFSGTSSFGSSDITTSTLFFVTTDAATSNNSDLAWVIPIVIIIILILIGVAFLLFYCIRGLEIWCIQRCHRWCSCCGCCAYNTYKLHEEHTKLTDDDGINVLYMREGRRGESLNLPCLDYNDEEAQQSFV